MHREINKKLGSFRSTMQQLLESGDREKAWNENDVLGAGKISFSFVTRGLFDVPGQFFFILPQIGSFNEAKN